MSKDKNISCIRIKKGRASDKFVGQIQPYIVYIKSEIANDNQEVNGLSIGLSDDLGLKHAIGIEFRKY